MRNRLLTALAAVVLLAAAAMGAFAEGTTEEEEYPSKSAEFMIPFGAGGSADTLGRAMTRAAEPYFGESLVPVNRVGGGGAVMYQEMVNSGDEYSIGWSSTSILTVTNIGNVPFGYDALDHVARIGYTSMPLAVRADAPWDTVEEFVAEAKSRPGEILIGNAGTGSATHLVSIVFATKAGVDVVHVPNGAERRVPALLGGETQAVVVPLPEIAPFVESGDAKILAFPTVEREPAFPGVPTMQEAGYDVVIELFRSISVPKGTDPEVIAFLEDVFRQASADPAFADIAETQGFLINFMGRDDFEDYLAAQDVVIADAMDAGGLR